jgi:hypothetical protein
MDEMSDVKLDITHKIGLFNDQHLVARESHFLSGMIYQILLRIE